MATTLRGGMDETSAGKTNSNAMWGGRFASGPDAVMEAINASIDFDRRLYAEDIAASRAHAAMLGATGASLIASGREKRQERALAE